MYAKLAELENEFRQSWIEFDPSRYDAFLVQAPDGRRLELLTRLLSAELEYAYQPPAASPSRTQAESPIASEDDEDERIRPCLQLFLLRFPELSAENELLIRLVVLEYALRLQHDPRPPNPESYLSLCDDCQEKLIPLLELTASRLPASRDYANEVPGEVCSSDSTVKESQLSKSIALDPHTVNIGYFLLLNLIGKGGMGYVHAAIDLRSTAQVAVKVMRRVDAWSVYRFVEEFRWLSHLTHPNLVKLYDAFHEGDLRYFSMELVRGHTIRDWFQAYRNEADDPWRRLRKVFAQIASAISYLHDNEVIHCDIKSSNIMITEKGRAVVLDLGLAVRAGQANPLVGTLQYMAPEVLTGGDPQFASDWYSFGVMMYEVMTDSYPPIQVNFEAENKSNVYLLDREKLRENLSECDPEIAILCEALLATDPTLRPSGSETVARLGVDRQRFSGYIGHMPQAVRQREIGELNTVLESVWPNQHGCVVLRGESGLGKSKLLADWMEGINSQQYLIISLRCYQQDHTPLRLLNALVQELVSVLERRPREFWQPSLATYIERIGLVFPQIWHLSERLNPNSGRLTQRRSTPAPREKCLTELLQWLVDLSQQCPIVIAVDDAHWSDPESLRNLEQLLAPESRFLGLIVLVDDHENTLSETDVRLDRFVTNRTTAKFCQIDVEPLDQSVCIELLMRWSELSQSPLTAEDVTDLAQRSKGNPFLLQELVRSHVYHALRDVDDRSALDDAQYALRRRFASLPKEAEVVLQYVAVANQSLGFHQLQMVSRIPPRDLQQALSLLGSQGWIRSKSPGFESEVEVAHETFRRVVVEGIPEERLQRRHFRMARILSSDSPAPWPRIAAHYSAAERFREAATCYAEAARAALATGACQEALYFLELADHPGADRTPLEKRVLLSMKADCLAATGNSITAAEVYESLIDDAGREEMLLLECLAGEQWIRGGQLDQGLAQLAQTLKRLDISGGQRSRLATWSLHLKAVRLAMSTRIPDRQSSNQPEGHGFSAVERSLNRISAPLTFIDNQLGPELILRMDRLAQDRGHHADRAIAFLMTGILLSFAGRRWRPAALRRIKLGRRLANGSQNDLSKALARLCMTVLALQQGELKRSLRHGAIAINLYQGLHENAHWEEQFLRWSLLGPYWHTLQLRRLRRATEELRQQASGRQDPMSVFWMHVSAAHWSDLVGDEHASARRSLSTAEQAIANQTFQSPRFFLWLSRVHQELYEGNAARAATILRQDWRELSKAMILSTNHYRWLALAARSCCNLLCARQQPERRRYFYSAALQDAKLMLKLEEPAFVAWGKAVRLVAQAGRGKVADAKTWRATIADLYQLEHHLVAIALQWHWSLHAQDENSRTLGQVAEQALRDEGCVCPATLLNNVLPLPIDRTK